jgi:large subunit ribosomal protein L10
MFRIQSAELKYILPLILFTQAPQKGAFYMPKTRLQKEETVVKLKDKLQRSKSVVFTDYQGMTMTQLSDLRNKLLDAQAEFSVTKNNLIKIALKDALPNSNSQIPDSVYSGSIATLFSYDDEINPIKILTKALKDNQVGQIKAGLLDGEFMDQYKVQKLASLPSKDELRAKVVGSLGSPLYGIVGVLQANLRNLVYALDQIRISKGGE